MKIEKKPLIPNRLRKIEGSFAFLPHAFISKGFWASLTTQEILLYVLLVLVGDHHGLSYYSQDKLCILLRMDMEDFMAARNSLIKKSLIAFDGFLFQVLSLPDKPLTVDSKPLETPRDFRERDPFTIRGVIHNTLKSDKREVS